MLEENKFKKILLLSFALSGMSVFIYEVVWMRPLQLTFGSTVYAVSAMLTSFMIGFTLGAYLFRNIADRSKNPALLFAFLELGIGLYGLIIISLFKLLPSVYLSLLGIPGSQFFQLILVFAVLIIPTTLFGATWPVMNKAYVSSENIGRDVGRLYSLNSLGGVLGSLGAGFLLIPLLGIRNTSLSVASLNLLIAVMVFIYVKRKNEK